MYKRLSTMFAAEEGIVNIVNIVDRGDVVLVVGSGDDVLKLKVNSVVLRMGSKTFEAMLGPNFIEGRRLNYDDPPDLPLPEDNPIAMKSICYGLHLKPHLIPKNLRPDQILEIVQAIDKYALRDAYSTLIPSWLVPKLSSGFFGSWKLLKAAHLLQDRTSYKAITKVLVQRYEQDYLTLLTEEDSTSLAKVIGELERTRTQLRQSIVQGLHQAMT